MSEIPHPKDHEGREIPLDTEVLYSAKDRELHVSSYRYQCDQRGCMGQCWQHPADSLYLTPPDSLEKLADDLDRVADRQDGTEEFFAVDDEIMVGPCSSRDESAHEFGRWKISREINRYNAMKEFLDDARRRD